MRKTASGYPLAELANSTFPPDSLSTFTTIWRGGFGLNTNIIVLLC